MAIFSGAGREAGVEAAKVAAEAIDEATDTAERIAFGISNVAAELTDKGIQALAGVISELEGLVYRLDGATFTVYGIEGTITNPVTVTFKLGQFKPE